MTKIEKKYRAAAEAVAAAKVAALMKAARESETGVIDPGKVIRAWEQEQKEVQG